MSDAAEPEGAPATGEVVAEKAEAFFTSINASTACPVCENIRWEVIANGELQPGLPMTGEWQVRSTMPYVPLSRDCLYTLRLCSPSPTAEGLGGVSSISPSLGPGPPLRLVAASVGVAGSGGPPHDGSMEARISAIEGRFDRIDIKLDTVEDRLRGVETAIASIDGKMTVLVGSVVGKLPSWWQMPLVITGTAAPIIALLGIASRLHLISS